MGEIGMDARVERTRAFVAAAALDLVREGGPEAVTHQRVAERAGVGRATVYRHWPNRRSLILDALEAMSLSIAPPEGLSVRDSLVFMLETLCDRLESPVALAMSSLIARAEWEPEVRTFLDRVLMRAKTELEGVLRRAVSDNPIERDLPTDTALSLIAGPFFYERFIAGRIVSREYIQTHVDAFLGRWGKEGDG
jgi:AcrR family transcriptional regulator